MAESGLSLLSAVPAEGESVEVAGRVVAEAPVISLHDVSRSFGGLKVLDRLTLEIPARKTTVIVGPSGTGKSVLLKHIVGLLKPESGRIEVFGQDITHASERELVEIRKRFGMLFQDGALFGSMTVGENVAFPLQQHTSLSSRRIREIVAEKLSLVGLPGTEGKLPAELSGGMRKRVALARAIVMEPEVVLFDEPQSGLDPVTADAIDELILEMKQRLHVTFIVISHDMVGTFKIADWIGMLYHGQLIAYGSPLQFRTSRDPRVQQFLARNLVGSPLDAFLQAQDGKGKL